jgi:hypothetical protein
VLHPFVINIPALFSRGEFFFWRRLKPVKRSVCALSGPSVLFMRLIHPALSRPDCRSAALFETSGIRIEQRVSPAISLFYSISELPLARALQEYVELLSEDFPIAIPPWATARSGWVWI